jgi:hypothetical protein
MSMRCQTYLQASNASIFENSCAIQKSAVTPAGVSFLHSPRRKENMLLLLIHPSSPAAPTTTSGPAATTAKPSMASAGVSFSKVGAAVMVGFALFTVLLQAMV